ncbi:hypothetical protein FQN54_001106 [Arachnomyces sp. PD_36]|nr:hypothetical protein FQN54_001106 [Arachnomyces sp. PD_36]
MPSPSATRRSTNRQGAKSTPPKPKLDIGEPLGPYDTNPVRERVRRWQQQGGGVITANDVCVEESEEDEKPPPEPKPRAGRDRDARARRTPVGSASERDEKPSSNEKARNSNERTRPKVRSSGTPKKRVVSDQHWRTKRSPEDKSGARKRVDVPRTRERNSPRPSKEETTSQEDLSKPEPAPKLDDDGIRVYATTPSPRKKKARQPPPPDEDDTQTSTMDEREREEKDLTSDGIPTSPSARRTPTKRRQGNRRESNADREPKHRSPPRNKTKRPERNSRSPESPEQQPDLPAPKKLSQGNLKPPKGGIFSHVIDESKKMFGKPSEPPPPAPPPQPPRRSKVDAWLSETRDPFLDDDDEFPVEIPAPLKTNSRRKKTPPQEHVGKGDSTSTIDTPTHSESHRRKSSHGDKKRFKEQDYSMPDYDDLSPEESVESPPEEKLPRLSRSALGVGRESRESSPTSLKRTGARKHASPSPKHKRGSTISIPNEYSPRNSNGDAYPLSDGSDVSPTDWTPLRPAKRPFPTTGMHRLSTIASVPSETATNFSVPPNRKPRSPPREDTSHLEGEERDQFDPNSLPRTRSNGLRRQLTTSADLMSVLSAPGRSRSIRSARSIRTNRSRLANATVDDLMRELTSDETKYMRELKTLVGGVIPVLLTCVLSKTDSAVAAGLFRPFGNPNGDSTFTKPIVDMGVALERLKSLHKRIPLDNSELLLTWAKGAQRVYADYLKAWRLGFQDVVVNLAPPDENDSQAPNDDTQSLDEGMDRDSNGDVIDADGEKVDVAYLLKRPLVRLKYLAKTFKGLNILNHSPKAEDVAMIYQGLVTDARRRSNEERARLEDDSASAVDSTRARDPRTLSILTDVPVNQTRRVRARDSFNLSLHHSSGQRVDCRAELLLRDNSAEDGAGGDLFVCEVDDTGRWLLFPPIDCGLVSARNGDSKGEIVVMIRGHPGPGRDWQELLSLKTDDEQTGLEWVQMIGTSPVPPKIIRTQSFLQRTREQQHPDAITNTKDQPTSPTSPSKSRTPSPRHIDVPIGEQATTISSQEADSPDVQRSSSVIRRRPMSLQPLTTPNHESDDLVRSDRSPHSHSHSHNKSRMSVPSPKSLNEAMQMAGDGSPSPSLKRSKAKRISRYGESSPTGSPLSPTSPISDLDRGSPATSRRSIASEDSPKHISAAPKSYHTPSPGPTRRRSSRRRLSDEEPIKPITRRSLSPVPSMEFPTIPKIRSTSQSNLSQKSVSDDGAQSSQSTPTKKKTPDRPMKPAGSLTDPVQRNPTLYTEDVPVPPPHKSPSPSQMKKPPVPVLSPTTPRQGGKRRSSSPLKHEYEPSSASEPSSSSEASTVEHHEVDYSSSDTSEEEDLEEGDIPTPLPPLRPRQAEKSTRQISPPSSRPTTSSGSSSKDGSRRSSRLSKTVASVFYWSDKGSWQPLHSGECNIIITPGLIEAYAQDVTPSKGTDSHVASDGSSVDGSSVEGERPLIGFELTPLVPLRRGTALDISIRSIQTPKSKFKAIRNIMFRSRSPDDCETLYGLINRSRIHNAQYIALQNARPPYSNQPPPPLERYNSTRSGKSGGFMGWANGLKSSYRASSAPTPSLAGVSESSVGTMSSAFSALKRFGASSKMFSIARSTVTSRTGSRAGSMYSGGSSGSGSNAIPPGGLDGGIGLTNAKIRLYERALGSKWRDKGSARLTIMPASPPPSRPSTSGAHDADGPESISTRPSGQPASAARLNGPEKRIVIRGKTRNEVLLDVCLGESCFERVARTGIALSVWQEFEGGTVAKEGGVVGGTFKVYMIQMKTEADTAYTFGLVGKQRY